MCRWRTAQNYLAGLVLGDGTLYYYKKPGNYYIEIYDNNREFLENVGRELKTTLKVKYWITKPSKHNYHRLRVSGKELYERIKTLIEKRLKSPTKGFVRGLIDAEGTLYVDKKGRIALEIANKRYDVIKAVSMFLKRKGIHHTITKHSGKKSVIYKVRIRGWKNVEKALNEIKPKHPKIVKKYDKLKTTYLH